MIEKIEDNILIATFSNGKYNPITLDDLKQLGGMIKKVNETEELKGIVLTGDGKIFSSGFDLPTFLGFKNLDEAIAFFEVSEQVFMDLFMCKKPVISAINGHMMAGGFIAAMGTDYRIIKNHPKIQVSMSEIKIGLGLSIVQTELMRFGLNGDRMFRDVMYNGERYNVEQAKELGIVDEIYDGDDLVGRAKEMVVKWIDNPGRAFSLLKKTLRQPALDRMEYYLKNSDWKSGFNCIFDPQTRATIEAVSSMMK